MHGRECLQRRQYRSVGTACAVGRARSAGNASNASNVCNYPRRVG
jgi:hypothetical protein